MEFVLELIAEFFGELLLQLLGEFFGDAVKVTWYKLRGRDHELSATQEASWSVVTGVAVGLVTVWLVPQLALRLPWLQMLNVLVAPLLAGLLVERVRAWREKRLSFSLPVAGFAALFGFAFAAARWLFGQ
ncbi:MAG: hypothetical protein JWQ72_820 [Polaromonas sp.]|nr:hypothetical protein [Polaromonas sp.]